MAYPVSTEFRNALRYGHKVATLAQVCTVDGDVLATLEPLSGAVTVDVDRLVRREAGDLQLVDSTGTLTPLDVDDLLNPLNGYEIRLYRGITYPNTGDQDLVPLGVFGYTSARVDDTGSGVTFALGGLVDRSERVSRARYSTRVQVTTTNNETETVITAILQQAWGDVPFAGGQLPTTGTTVPVSAFGVEGDSDPWRDAVQVAESKGYRLYFNVEGQVTMSQVVDAVPSTGVVSYGGTDLLVLSMSKTWDTADTYNGILAIGETSNLRRTIPRFTAWDTDQNSPTYYLGNFGKRLRVYSSPLITTVADAERAARLQLAKTRGVAERLSWSQIVDPSLDVDDPVTVTQASVGVDATYLLSRLSIPLGPTEAMTAESKQRRVT